LAGVTHRPDPVCAAGRILRPDHLHVFDSVGDAAGARGARWGAAGFKIFKDGDELAIGPVAHRVHHGRQPGGVCPADVAGQDRHVHQRHAATRIQIGIDHPGGPGAHAAVGKKFDMADAQPVVAEPGLQAQADDIIQAISRAG
jgi:hypothetical protein